MLRILMLMVFGYSMKSVAGFATSSAFGGTTTKSLLPYNCDIVKSYLEAQGFSAINIPNEPVLSRELKVCKGINSSSKICCSVDIEMRLQVKARSKHDKAIRDTLQRLQHIFYIRATRFRDFFNDLLTTSKKSFHEMFKKTYGILYEQNAYVFTDLFRELEKYYSKGSVDLDDVMDTFFNTLYQKMFTVLNSQYKFDNKYLECVGHHMKEMRPFGDVPQKLGVQIKRSFIATRAFSQALQTAAEVVKNMQQLKSSNNCVTDLTRMTVCPSCAGIPSNILACNNMCENIMKGCLAEHAALDADWNHFVEAVDKVADRLLGPFNIEMLVRPINLKISEAIMNFQESSSDVSQRVFTGCGRPILGRRRRRRRRNLKEVDEQNPLKFNERSDIFDKGDEEQSSSAIILDKLVREIKQRIRDSRQFWLYLPYKLCSESLVAAPSNTNDCWNGSHIDKYIYPLSSNGESQNLHPEVKTSGLPVNIVHEQVIALTSISNRLRLAFNGHDVDWVDTDENWSSGSGSGSGSSVDSITDDEDGFAEEGSGFEITGSTESDLIKPKEQEEQTVSPHSVPPVNVDKINYGSEHDSEQNTENNVKLEVNVHQSENKTQIAKDSGATATSQRLLLSKAFVSYILPIVIMWFGSYLTEWL